MLTFHYYRLGQQVVPRIDVSSAFTYETAPEDAEPTLTQATASVEQSVLLLYDDLPLASESQQASNAKLGWGSVE